MPSPSGMHSRKKALQPEKREKEKILHRPFSTRHNRESVQVWISRRRLHLLRGFVFSRSFFFPNFLSVSFDLLFPFIDVRMALPLDRYNKGFGNKPMFLTIGSLAPFAGATIVPDTRDKQNCTSHSHTLRIIEHSRRREKE